MVRGGRVQRIKYTDLRWEKRKGENILEDPFKTLLKQLPNLVGDKKKKESVHRGKEEWLFTSLPSSFLPRFLPAYFSPLFISVSSLSFLLISFPSLFLRPFIAPLPVSPLLSLRYFLLVCLQFFCTFPRFFPSFHSSSPLLSFLVIICCYLPSMHLIFFSFYSFFPPLRSFFFSSFLSSFL